MNRDEYRWEVLAGEAFKLGGLMSGGTVRFDRNVAGRGVTATAAVNTDGEATWTTPDEPGTVYVWFRESATDGYRRIGTLDVVSGVDAEEEQLRTEVADLDRRILALESGHVQVQGADGMGLTRVALPGLRKQRAYAHTRLRDYQRRKAGIPPAGLV